MSRWDQALNVTNIFFIELYAFEATLRIVGLSPRAYFSSNWNRFDFALALFGVIGAGITGTAAVCPVS